jgi:hypothetical protein
VRYENKAVVVLYVCNKSTRRKPGFLERHLLERQRHITMKTLMQLSASRKVYWLSKEKALIKPELTLTITLRSVFMFNLTV